MVTRYVLQALSYNLTCILIFFSNYLKSGTTATGHWYQTSAPYDAPESALTKCIWTHCIDAPAAPASNQLNRLVYAGADYSYDTTEVAFNSKVQYHCFNGMKSVRDMGFAYQEATCLPDNVWTKPTEWENCTDSELIPYIGT